MFSLLPKKLPRSSIYPAVLGFQGSHVNLKLIQIVIKGNEARVIIHLKLENVQLFYNAFVTSLNLKSLK